MLMIKTHSKQPNAYKMTKSTSCTVKQLKKKHIIFSRHNYCISVTKYNRMPLVVTKCLYRKLMQRPRNRCIRSSKFFMRRFRRGLEHWRPTRLGVFTRKLLVLLSLYPETFQAWSFLKSLELFYVHCTGDSLQDSRLPEKFLYKTGFTNSHLVRLQVCTKLEASENSEDISSEELQ